MMVCVPSGITSVEMKAVIDSATQCGAGKVYLIEEPMAAAIGSKLPIHEIAGSMIVDIGGGTTEMAVISQYAVAYSESLRMAGDAMDEASNATLKGTTVYQSAPLRLNASKWKLGRQLHFQSRLKWKFQAQMFPPACPHHQTFDESVRNALDGPVKAIVESIRKALAKTSPELASDIYRRGIVLAGGGSLLKGLGTRLHDETGLPIYRVKDPLTTVVRGTGHVLDHLKDFKKVCLN